jgi:hypothetical protein
MSTRPRGNWREMTKSGMFEIGRARNQACYGAVVAIHGNPEIIQNVTLYAWIRSLTHER